MLCLCHIVSTHSSVDGHLIFHFLAIMDNVNTHLQVLVWVDIFIWEYTGVWSYCVCGSSKFLRNC